MKVLCKYDELVSVKSLKPHPKNRNKHPKDQIERLAKILDYQGVRAPIIVSKLSGYICKGHGTLLAIQENGWDKAPVVFQEFDAEDQEYSFVQSDNAIANWAELDLSGINIDLQDLGPDFDVDMLGIRDFEIEPADKYQDQDADAVPEIDKTKTISKLGDLYELGPHRLLCGDSTDKATVERLMDGEKADMVFTDPTYGINEEGDRSGRGGITQGNNLKSFKDDSVSYAVDAFNLCQGLSIPIQVWFGANYYCHSLPQTNNWLVWDKRIEEKQTDNNSDAELAWVQDGKSSVRIFRHLWKGLIKGSEHGERRVHPTQKPIALAEWCFNKYDTAKAILDLFGGSGSTLIACEKTNRKCYMMELDPHYIDVIVTRWCKFTGKTEIKRNGEPIDWSDTGLLDKA
jgi:DNA modification methylase